MKKLLSLLLTIGSPVVLMAQQAAPRFHADSLLSRWVIDVNLLGGLANQTYTTTGSAANYPNAVNANTGQLTFRNGYSYGADAQAGFFFGKKRHFGLGTGFMYMEQRGDASLNNFHVEYQATDGGGNTFRQVVTGNDVKENIVARSYNIPVLLKYKNRFSKHWGITADAGAVINLKTQNAYTTHASFDYEAIYKFSTIEGIRRSVYDNSPTPDAGDWLITKAEFLKNNPNGNVEQYFAAKRAVGYIVGDNLDPGAKTGNTTYNQVTVGLVAQPSVNYFLSDHVALNLGVYYMIQPVTNNTQNGYRLTEGVGKYSSVTNSVSAATDQSYGINLGARFFLGSARKPLHISYVNQNSPSACGICDGSIAFHGLPANEHATIHYSLNGAPAATYQADVNTAGEIKMPDLCAGSYTDIVAKIGRKKAGTAPVTLQSPAVKLTTQDITSPTSQSTCNGTINFNGTYATGKVIVSYKLDGYQKQENSIVNADHSISVRGLCPGSYTNVVVQVNNCTANGSDFILAAAKPVIPAPLPVAPVINTIDISTPILFDVNMANIHSSSYPVIEKAAQEMNENAGASLTIDGNADASGSEAKNQVLSLQRANAVKAQLTQRGIKANRLKTIGHGSKMPVATNQTVEGKRENRRAVMHMTGK